MGRTIRWVQTCIRLLQWGDVHDRFDYDRSHALRGNAARDALRPKSGRRASIEAFPRRAWELSREKNSGVQYRRLRVSEGSSPNCLR